MPRTTSPQPPFRASSGFTKTAPPDPSWNVGSGASTRSTESPRTLAIDPYSPSRSASDNYRLLVSGIIPRPIGFVSTVGADGSANLAPFSYLSLANHDPPIFTLGFSSGMGADKDTARQLLETAECTINIVSEEFVAAANYTAIDAPAGVSEWALSGLTPQRSDVVAPPRVGEAVFAVEARLVASHEWTSRTSGRKTGTTAIVEGVRFHVREDALTENGALDPAVLRPVSRLGGVSYGRTTEAYDLPRPRWADEKEKPEVRRALGLDAEGEQE